MTLHIGRSTYPDLPGDEGVDSLRSRNQRARVLSNLLAELIVGGIKLKEAGFYGSYDLLRPLIVQLERQYTDFINEEEPDAAM